MKLCSINVECLANMHTNTHHFILQNNDFTCFVYELRGQPSYKYNSKLQATFGGTVETTGTGTETKICFCITETPHEEIFGT